MNTSALRTLAAVAEHGSMAAAARRLRLTHGAVAQQLRALEAELGAPLVVRAGRTVHLTSKATDLLAPIQVVLEQVERIRQLARSDEVFGELRLGAGSTALNSVMPAILERFLQHYPRASVDLRPGHSGGFYRDIEAGELDAAIALEAPFPLSKMLGWQLLREEPYVLVAAGRHRSSNAHALLANQPFLRYSRTEWTGRPAEEYLRRVGIQVKDRFELNAIESIAAMASRNLGVAILPRSTNDVFERLGLAVLPLPEPCEPRRFGFVWSRAYARQELIRAFLQTAADEYQRLARI